MNPLTLYHVTAKRNRGAIRRYGLLPRDTSDHNYPGLWQQPTGVFGTVPDWYLFCHSRGTLPGGDERDVWRLDVLGLPVVRDNILPAWVVTDVVPPERLTLVKTLRQVLPGSFDWEGGWPTCGLDCEGVL